MAVSGRLFTSCMLLSMLMAFSQVGAYRLNVPRVLLPYHPTIPVKFELAVGQPTGGCFHWRSTRPDVVVVSPSGVRPGACSDHAEIRAVAKGAAGELTAVIFAEDKVSGTMLSCGVSVDHIAEIHIYSTTKVLFVDAAPVRMIVQAFNKEGDSFSTMSAIPMDWELSHTENDRPLRIVPFEQSTYEAPPEIVALEKLKRKGFVVLVEGMITGSATLSAKFNDPYLESISAHSIDLTVVANLLLIPAHDLYVPIHSVVPFEVLIVKQHSTESVAMPSTLYYLQVDSTSICSLDATTSSIYALSRGRTDVHLLSHNLDVKTKTGVRPPSTAVHVVDPETLQWGVSGDNWFLEVGREYTLRVSLLDPHDNIMFIGDNLRFESVLHLDHFNVHTASLNQTHYVVTPKKVGKTVIKSKFVSIVNKDGHEEPLNSRVHGEQVAYIVDPVRIDPHFVALPLLTKAKSNYHLRASGGSGLYDWSVTDPSICGIDASSGLISTGVLGTTTVTAADRRNAAHFDTAEVSVLEILSLSFGKTMKEAEVGDILALNLELFGSGPAGPVPFTDCTNVRWTVQAADQQVFQPIKDAISTLPIHGTGCATVYLRAVASGDTKVTVSTDKYHATLDVSAYNVLKLKSDTMAIAVGSEHSVSFMGGVRPWLLDPDHHYLKAKSTNSVSANVVNGALRVQCSTDASSASVSLLIGNAPSETLPLPLISEITVSVCCAVPSRLAVLSPRDQHLAKCHSSSHVILPSASLRVYLSGYGVCAGAETALHSISGLKVKWTSDKKVSLTDADGPDSGFSTIATGLGKLGSASVTASVSAINGIGKLSTPLKATTNILLVEKPYVDSPSLLLWNEQTKTNILIHGGSGQFRILESKHAPYSASLVENRITVIPQSHGAGTLRISDACLLDSEVDMDIKISDIHSLAISGPKFVEMGTEVRVKVDPADETGSSFSQYQGSLTDSKIDTNNDNLQLIRREEDMYVFRALSAGVVSLTASARSSSGRALLSRPLSVQIYSPIALYPKLVTLIPESVFQLEVFGGPIPTPPIEFSLNNSKIAAVESNALITSKAVGYTSVAGTINVAGGHLTKDSVVVRVVRLAGIRLVASSQRLESGGRCWIRLEGVDSDETPFAFGGAIYPFKVTWSVSHPETLKRVHPLGHGMTETYANRFAVWYDAQSAGSVSVKVRVDLSGDASNAFADHKRFFETSLDLDVEESFSLRVPDVPLGVVRIAPNSQLRLETRWPSSTVEFSVLDMFGHIMSVTKEGQLKSFSREGSGAIKARRTLVADNETTLIPVVISAVHSLDVFSSTELQSSSNSRLVHIPVGTVLQLKVVFRDQRGRALHAADNTVSYRPHRFDLTEIVPLAENRTLSVTMKDAGETVLKIWDTASPSVFVFLRLSAQSSLLPHPHNLFVSDIVCFHSPLSGAAHWFSSDSSIHWIDPERGVGRLVHAGSTHVTARMETQSLHARLSIGVSRELQFAGSVPKFVTNSAGAVYVFPVGVRSNTTKAPSGCTSDQLSVLSEIRPPIECTIYFSSSALPPAVNFLSTKPVYSQESGSYACVVERQVVGTAQMNVADSTETNLVVSVKWNSDSRENQKEFSVNTIFHPTMDVLESEIRLSDVDSNPAIVSVLVPSYQSRHVSLTPCSGDLVIVSAASNPYPESTAANKFFKVKLNVRSAVLWSEVSNKCELSLENSLTGQKIAIPVMVKIVGAASKHRYDALGSNGFVDFVLIFLQHYSWIIPSLMWTCLLGILAIGAYWYLRRRLWEKSGSFGDVNNSSVMSGSFYSPSMQGTPASFRDSPVGPRSSVFNSSRMGASGHDDALWSTSPVRKYK